MSMYTHVHVLLLCWGTNARDNVPFKEQRASLAKEFENWNYTVDVYDIKPDSSAYMNLTSHLVRTIQDHAIDKPQSLLVIYYGGHGGQNKDNSAMWYCFDPDPDAGNNQNPNINWTYLQGLILYDYGAHVLLLLDCCQAGAAVQKANSANVVEVICAAGFEGLTPSRRNSFTTNLVGYLQQLRSEHVAIKMNSFYNELTDRMKRQPGHSVSPQYFGYYLGALGLIQLAPLPKMPNSNQNQAILVETRPSITAMTTLKHEVLPTGNLPLGHDVGSEINYYEPIVVLNVQRYDSFSDEEPFSALENNSSRMTRLAVPKPMRQAYVYEDIPRDAIRILRLLPGDKDSPLVCQFWIMPALANDGTHPPYIAISWVWAPDRTGKISIMTQHDDTGRRRSSPDPNPIRQSEIEFHEIEVPMTLSKALKSLRRRNREIDLWVDNLCIDHANQTAISRMLGRYPEIYQGATGVYAWIGSGDHNTETSLEFINQLNTASSGQILTDPKLSMKWAALVGLLDNPFFSRRWIFQELAFAREITLVVGHRKRNWSRLCEAISVADTIFEKAGHSSQQVHALQDLRSLDAFDLVEATRNFFRKNVSNSARLQKLANLEMLVCSLPRLQNFDFRDTITALTGAASDGAEIVFGEGKNSSYELSTLEVYQDFVQHCIRTSKSINIICRYWAPTKKIEEFVYGKSYQRGRLYLPSWMQSIRAFRFGPRDNVLGRITQVSLVGTPRRCFYDASKGTQGNAFFRDIKTKSGIWTKSLTVCGFELGRISLLEPPNGGMRITDEAAEIAGWDSDSSSVPDHLWRTLVADRGPNGMPPPPWYQDACLFWLKKFHKSSRTSLTNRDDYPELAREFLARVVNITYTRRYMSLRDHEGTESYGLAPNESGRGDSVVILQGCSVPVVLRRSDRCEMSWELVGECFVYGAMDGEAMLNRKKGASLSEYELV